MAGYTPVFSAIYDGTLCGKWPTAAVWASLLPLVDVRGEIRMTYEAIHVRTGWPLDLLRLGIAELMQPDPLSQSRIEQGRRLVLIDASMSWGWRAVNHSKYREKARKAMHDERRRDSGENTERMATRRDPSRPATGGADPLSDSDTNTNTIKEKKAARVTASSVPIDPAEMGEFRLQYPRRAGSQPWRRAFTCIRARLDAGHTWAELIDGAKRYRMFCEASGKIGTELVMQAATFAGPEEHFLEPWPAPKIANPAEEIERAALQKLTARRAAIGLADFREPFDGETAAQYRKIQDDEWERRRYAVRKPPQPQKPAPDLTGALKGMQR